MRKSNRTWKSSRRTNTRGSKTTRRTTARWTTRKTSRRTTSRTGTTRHSNTTCVTRRWAASPYTQAFVAGCRTGQPCSTVINNICKRTGKNFNTVCASLCKAGVCRGQKFNGQWICWPNFKVPTNNTWSKKAQWNLWQGFVDWCVTSGYCTPNNLNTKSATGNQAQFMKNCQSLMSTQCTLSGTTKIKPAANLKNSTNTWTAHFPNSTTFAWTRTFKFPTLKNLTRRYSKAA